MSLIKPIISEISSIKTAYKAGARLAHKNNQGAIKGIRNGVTQVYKHTGALPIVTGAAAGVGLAAIPGTTIIGVIAGVFLKKGLKSLLRSLK